MSDSGSASSHRGTIFLLNVNESGLLPAGKDDVATCRAQLDTGPAGDALEVGKDVKAGSAFCFQTSEKALALVTVVQAGPEADLRLSLELWPPGT
ncbi:hypothetical protein [Thermoactinospora rubra]|uniref:hypothetical protein n=1 Tax=Thermoactinospora rubra TaxID=1088767 RepID=UPI000A106D44|nr:hypothetical protein [Thermoactinospora rubra]